MRDTSRRKVGSAGDLIYLNKSPTQFRVRWPHPALPAFVLTSLNVIILSPPQISTCPPSNKVFERMQIPRMAPTEAHKQEALPLPYVIRLRLRRKRARILEINSIPNPRQFSILPHIRQILHEIIDRLRCAEGVFSKFIPVFVR